MIRTPDHPVAEMEKQILAVIDARPNIRHDELVQQILEPEPDGSCCAQCHAAFHQALSSLKRKGWITSSMPNAKKTRSKKAKGRQQRLARRRAAR